jgi:hypothetical protein
MSMTDKKLLGRAPRVRITVTEENIVYACRRDSSHCMIAEAIKAQVPGARYVSVDLQTIRWTHPTKNERYTYLTPRVAQVALVDLDRGVQMAPFDFQTRGGQTTRAGVSTAYRKARKQRMDLNGKTDGEQSARVSMRETEGGSGLGNSVPERVGGRTPPLAALSNRTTAKGKRRAFGLRGLNY